MRLPHAPSHTLLPYEQALYDAIFEGREAVLLSQLSGSFAAHLGKVRDALYADVVRQGWFARRPDAERTLWTTVGVVLLVAGVVSTALLAWFTSYGLLGLAVIIAGGALAVGGQYMPSPRPPRGRRRSRTRSASATSSSPATWATSRRRTGSSCSPAISRTP
ncbi:DUF2207 family protein [Nonomuraea ferruginea]